MVVAGDARERDQRESRDVGVAVGHGAADELGPEQYEAFLNATNRRANLTDPLSQGNIASGLGCDGDMWRALRGWFVFQLVTLGLACFCVCCASYVAMTLADMRAEGY